MMNNDDESIRWVPAPEATAQGTPSVNGVYLKEGEEVEWIWSHNAEGSFVSGAQIVKRGD